MVELRRAAIDALGPPAAWALAFALTALAPSSGIAQSQTQQTRIVSEDIKALAAPSPGRRRTAATEIGNFTGREDYCRAAATAIPALLKALKDLDPSVREMAAWAIGNIHSDPATTVPALIIMLRDKDDDVRKRAAGALTMNANCGGYTAKDLGSNGPSAASALAAALHDNNDDVRDAAGQSLRTYGTEAGSALPALIELLSDKKARTLATRVITAIGPDAQPAVPALTAMLTSDDVEVQLDAAAALASIGANLQQALPVAARLLSHDQWDIRFKAAVVVGSFGAAALPAIPRLTLTLDDSEADVRRVAIASFKQILAALVEARRTDAIKVLQTAAATVGRSRDHEVALLGPDIDEAIAALEAMQTPRSR